MGDGTTTTHVPTEYDIQIRDTGRGRRCCALKIQSTALLAILLCSALPVALIASEPVAAAPIEMRIGTTESQDTFNPFSMMSGVSWMVAWEMYEVLVTRNPTTLEPMPMLAQSWETSPDGKVWTFHLATNSTWHDNTPVTAEDVNWTFNFIIDHPNECGLYQGYIGNITEVVALDASTVRFTTDVPKATMLTMNVPILPKHLWSAVPLPQLGGVDLWNTKYFPNGPVGSGPMVLVSYSKTLGDIWMYKWSGYHGGDINVDRVLYKMFTSEDAMMNALSSGSIDLAMQVPTSLWTQTISTPGIEGQVANQLDMHHFGFNCASPEVRFGTDGAGHPLFPKASTNIETLNVSVRRACAMAINKTQVVNEILMGLADEGDTVIPPITPYWKYDVPDEEELKFDPAKARALLNAAGYVDSDGDGIRENSTSGAKLDFQFYYPTGYAADELAAGKIAGWLSDIGVHAPATRISETVLFSYQYNMKYDMFFWSWWPEYDPSFILSVLTTDQIPHDNADYAAWSDTFYSNPRFDQLYIEQQATVDPSARQAKVHEMQRIVYHDSPYVIMWYPYALFAYRTDKFTNFPDFTAQPGATPDNYFFFMQVMPKTGNQSPVFDAPLNPTYSAIVNIQQTFQVQVSDVDNDKLWVNWTFGDGTAAAHDVVNAGSSATPVTLTQYHTYTTLNPSPGYTIMVTLTDGIAGHEKTVTSTVYVITTPDGGPSFTSAVTSVPANEAYNDTVVTWSVSAKDSESGGSTGFGLRFTWIWDDGQVTVSNHKPTVNDTPVLDTATHSWSFPATYNVEVWVWDGFGLQSDPDHNISSGAMAFDVVVNTEPAEPIIAPIAGNEDVWIDCVASSRDADPDNLRFTWIWDDGTKNVTNHVASLGAQVNSMVTHMWPSAGTYSVTVWVDDLTDTPGHNVSATIDATVFTTGTNVPPNAPLITPPSPPVYTGIVRTYTASVRDTDGDAMKFLIDFGDGSAASATLPAGVTTSQHFEFTHAYSDPGSYTIGLWVNDSTGPASHNVTTTSTVAVVENSPPSITLPSSLTIGYNRTITVTPTQCSDSDGDVLQVWYDWGDGSPMTQGGGAGASYSASHVYSSLGDKTLTVTVDDVTGLAGHNVSASATVRVFEANLKPEVVGVIEKSPSKTSYEPSETITFTIVVRDFEGDNMTLTVEFGDGDQEVLTIAGDPVQANTNITKNVTHAYQEARSTPYQVNATVSDDMDHSDTVWSVGHASVQVAAPTPPEDKGGLPLSLLAGGIALAAIAALVILVLLKRKKKGSESPGDETPPPPKD